MDNQAVTIHFAYGSTDLKQLHHVEDQIIELLDQTGVGEFDGHDIAMDGSEGHLYMYGPDADALFKEVEPVLRRAGCLKNVSATLRYGSFEEEDARTAEIAIR